MALVEKFQRGIAIELEYSPIPLRVWNGGGTLTYNAKTYVPGKLLGTSETSLELTEPRQFVNFELSLTSAADRTFHFSQDRGPTKCTILWLWRVDADDTWKQAVSVSGRVSETNYTQGVLTVQVQQVIYDVDKGETILMDNATQQRNHAGDRGFEYAAQIAARGGLQQQFPWPP